MARITRKTRTGFFWIPRDHNYQYKIEIVRTGGTDTITTDVLDIKWNTPVTEEVGEFVATINNNTRTYNDLYSGGEVIHIYIDWGATPTTEVFEGTIETVDQKFDYTLGNSLELKGVHVSGDLLSTMVTEEIEGVTASTVIANLISEYATAFTDTNVEATGAAATAITAKWEKKPFWSAIKDICAISGCDCYVDQDKDFHFFEADSKECTQDACVWGDTLIEVEGLKTDTIDVLNQVTVIGEDENQLPIIATAKDSTSQTAYGLKEKIIKNTSINTYADASARAYAELHADPVLKGRAECHGMTYVRPGDKIWISNPIHEIHGQYKVYNIINQIKMGYFTTEIEVKKPRRGVPYIIRQSIEKDLAGETLRNKNKLEHSYNFIFDLALDEADANTYSYSDVTTDNSRLVLSSGKTTGNWESTARTVATTTEVELRVNGQDHDNSTFYISANNGLNWTEVVPNTLYDSIASGTQLKIKIDAFASDTDNPYPQIDSLAVLYK